MGFNPGDIVTLNLNCAGWHQPYTRDITRHQLGQLLLSLDYMVADTEGLAPEHAQTWPSPDEAYANAPHLVAETTTLQVTAADPEAELDREWHLRHAALLDRAALEIACFDNDPGAVTAAEEAEATAVILLDLDQACRDHDPRAYVRQQYALWAERERGATSTRRVTCYVAVCDLCGGTSDLDGTTPHLDTPQEAAEYVTASGGDDGWTLTADGLLVCDAVRDTAHEDAHAAAGKRMSSCAMTVTWSTTGTELPA